MRRFLIAPIILLAGAVAVGLWATHEYKTFTISWGEEDW